MTRPGLDVEGLVVCFGGHRAVDGVNLSAPLGRLTGLIGPNGAGKTTTFNACTGLVRPASGRIRLFGDDVGGVPPSGRARRGMGRTFQRPELFDSLSVADNVRLGRVAPLAGANPLTQVFGARTNADIDRAVDEALTTCGLDGLASRAARELPVGQRRLVELARVMAGPFDLLLLDEPSSGLDHRETARFGEILRALVDERGKGLLLVEHDMSLVMSTCDYVYVLDFGVLVFEGTPEEVQRSPVVRQAYLGSSELDAAS